MVEKKVTPIRNGLIVSLTSAVIVGIVTTLIPKGWSHVISFLWWLLAFVKEPVTIPVWLLMLFIVASCLIGLAAVIGVASSFSQAKDTLLEAPAMGIMWRWYSGMRELYSYCPECDLQIHPTRTELGYRTYETHYPCENCGWESQKFQSTPHAIENQAKRMIQRQLRLDEKKPSK